MAIRLGISSGWLYLTPTEEKTIIGCIKLLENARTQDHRLHTMYFQDKLKVSPQTTTHALNLLMAARIIRPQQYGRLRLYSLISGYRQRLKEKTRRIGKHKINSEQPPL